MERKSVAKVLTSINLPDYIHRLLHLNGFRTMEDLKQLDSDGIKAIETFVSSGKLAASNDENDPQFIEKHLGVE